MKEAILVHLNKCDEPQEVLAIVHFTGLTRLRVEQALIEFQEVGAVQDSGGRYRLSEAKRQEMANA